MKIGKKMISAAAAVLMLANTFSVTAYAVTDNSTMNMYKNSDFIEKEQPELTEATKILISQYQKSPTEENYLKLRDEVIKNYNAVLERKEAKLSSLKKETSGKPGGDKLVAEMEEIVQEMYITYWNRINSSMLRFTDTRLLKWRVAEASKYEYIPVMGAGESIYVKRTTVTNAEYAAYIKATGAKAPQNWANGTYPKGEDNYPVNYVSYIDAEAYCKWLTQKDGKNTYRLPTESEWELAAGHMPKDADFNCGVNNGRTPVTQYAKATRGAHGAVDFWGNVWEWTSTKRTDGTFGVKGGSYSSARTDCRTEYRKEGRNASKGYEDAGFRVIQVQNGKEPEKKADVAALSVPVVKAVSSSDTSVKLSWNKVNGAVGYQVFGYSDETKLVSMLKCVNGTSVTIKNLKAGKTYKYIVQPISYTSVCDNVSAEYCVSVTCGKTGETASDNKNSTSQIKTYKFNGMNYLLYTPANAEKNMPLIVYLHGSSWKGNNAEKLLEGGFPKYLNDGELGDVPAYVLMPQLPADKKGWAFVRNDTAALIKDVVKKYSIDSKNISITGFSMGAAGALDLAVVYPDMFSRIAVCGGALKPTQKVLSSLEKTPVWVFVGMDDDVVSPQNTIDFTKKLSEKNSQTKLTKYEGAAHTDIPALAYLDKETDLIGWLIGNK